MKTITTKDWIDLINENKQLNAQLANTNERVEELESELLMLTLATGRESTWQLGKQLLNKFAIEQQIKGMQRVLDCGELNLSQGDIDTIELMQEQLRKEQDSE